VANDYENSLKLQEHEDRIAALEAKLAALTAPVVAPPSK